jgi:hypothetical protein
VLNASDLQTLLVVKQIEKDVETQDMGIQALVNSDRLNQTKLAYKIDTGLKTIVTSIGVQSVLSVSRLKIPVVRVFLRLHVCLLQSIPSSDFPVTCQDV